MTKPPKIDPLADEILTRLACHPASSEIVLGGYLALQHHIDYRATHDIDAWWKRREFKEAAEAIGETVREFAKDNGMEFRERRFGETISWDLLRDSRPFFAFQIANRSITLETPHCSAWPPILIETLADTVASKMNALVDRGSPRDFVDVKAVVDGHLMTPDECWALWSRKNEGREIDGARKKVLLHLSGIESRRPLDSIADPKERRKAEETRVWVKNVFARI